MVIVEGGLCRVAPESVVMYAVGTCSVSDAARRRRSCSSNFGGNDAQGLWDGWVWLHYLIAQAVGNLASRRLPEGWCKNKLLILSLKLTGQDPAAKGYWTLSDPYYKI